MSRFTAALLGAAALFSLTVGTAQAALFGYNDAYWGSSIGSSTWSGSTPNPAVISLDPTVVQGWVNNPSTFYGVAWAPRATNYYGNTMFSSETHNWRHQQLIVNYTDGSSTTLDSTGNPSAMIAPISYTAFSGVAVGPDINVHTGTLGQANSPYLVLYGWNASSLATGKTVASASVSLSITWGDGNPFDVYAVPNAWNKDTVTYNTLLNLPEPASLSLLALGGLALLGRRR